MSYDKALSRLKGIGALLWAAIGSAVALGVQQIPVVEAGTAKTPTLEGILTAAITGLVVYGFARLNNWRKNSPRVPQWAREIALLPLLKYLFPALLLVAVAGCIHTRTTHPDGSVVDTWVPDSNLVREALAALPEIVQTIEDVKKDPELTPEERAARLEELSLKLEALKQILAATGRPVPLPEPESGVQ